MRLDEPFHIGDIEVRNRVLAAPLSGVSDLPFRQRTWNGGAGLVVSEMIASHELVHSSKESSRRALSRDCGPRMLQLAGREAYWMGEAAKVAVDSGAEIIDINMGCPAKKVTGGASGSALMRDLDHAMTLVEATVAAVDVPITLKMRLGWDDDSINAPELARRAVDAGIQMITVHGRTRCQFYDGSANWAAIADVRDVVDVPLVVNGDILSLDDAQSALQQSGADAVMVGRMGYGQPWAVGDMVRRCADLSTVAYDGEALFSYVWSHYQDMLEFYGERVGVRHARKHLGWYVDANCDNAPREVRGKLMQSNDPLQVKALLGEIFLQNHRAEEVINAA